MTQIRSRAAKLMVIAVATAGVLIPLSASTNSAGAMSFNPRGTVVVHARGIGHGHGMSQYGARGAALQGLSFRRILSFYYPHTRLVMSRHKPVIRVLLSDFGPSTTVAPYRGLHVTGLRDALPTRGVARYRLVADGGTGLALQSLHYGRRAHWHTYRRGLRNGASFYSATFRDTRIFAPNGSSNYYYGHLTSYRRASHGWRAGVFTVDRVNIDHYVAGVAPREMPSMWPHAAIRAQAVAARTYGMYAIAHPRAARYDICDTTDCQFYGGRSYYSASGYRVWVDDMPAAHATAYRYLTYGGHAIFAQFGASDGGWSSAGGAPYLISRRDPYDTSRSGDPYLSQYRRVRMGTLARYFGFASLSQINMFNRNGHGSWGGRVGSVHLVGRNSQGRTVRKIVSGLAFGQSVGYNTDWVHLSRS